MAKKSTKKAKSSAKKTAAAKKCESCGKGGCGWIVSLALFIALIAVTGIGAGKIMKMERNYKAETKLAEAKLQIVDDLMESYIREYEIVESGSVREVTGYGISDEDDVFYITFDFIRNDTTELKVEHGIMYFWPSEYGGYSHAYSYHDDDYHPGGEYVKIGGGYSLEDFEDED